MTEYIGDEPQIGDDMKIGIIGSGQVAQSLAAGFMKHGHQVTLGTRDPSKLSSWAEAHPGAKVGSFAEAATYGDAVVLAVKGTAAMDALELAGAESLAGKTVMDTTNPIAPEPPVNGVLKYFTGPNDSLMEQLQAAYPSANFVKVFNSVGNTRMVNPDYAEGKPTMFICGNNADAKEIATKILDQFGWESLDLGAAEAARAIEPLCILWCIPGFLSNEWTHAFKVLHA